MANSLLGAVSGLAMIVVTGSIVRGAVAFLILVVVLALFREINFNRCKYCGTRGKP